MDESSFWVTNSSLNTMVNTLNASFSKQNFSTWIPLLNSFSVSLLNKYRWLTDEREWDSWLKNKKDHLIWRCRLFIPILRRSKFEDEVTILSCWSSDNGWSTKGAKPCILLLGTELAEDESCIIIKQVIKHLNEKWRVQ